MISKRFFILLSIFLVGCQLASNNITDTSTTTVETQNVPIVLFRNELASATSIELPLKIEIYSNDNVVLEEQKSFIATKEDIDELIYASILFSKNDIIESYYTNNFLGVEQDGTILIVYDDAKSSYLVILLPNDINDWNHLEYDLLGYILTILKQ